MGKTWFIPGARLPKTSAVLGGGDIPGARLPKTSAVLGGGGRGGKINTVALGGSVTRFFTIFFFPESN